MKKILIVACLFLVTSVAGFSQEKNIVDSRTVQAFHIDFPGATLANWMEGTDFLKVSFSYAGATLFAYYKPGGELIAASRNISSFQLPVRLQTTLKNNFNRFWITDLFELSINGSTDYYVTLENSEEKKVLLASGGDWELFKISM